MSKLLPMLIAATGLNEHDVLRVLRNAPVRYKLYQIPKRRGGVRTIAQPAREVKALQRALVDGLLSRLPVHSSAMAYREGLSIGDNAAAHAKNGPILKFDFSNFFPSITAKDWHNYCARTSIFDNDHDVNLSTKILFHKSEGRAALRLAIGAPSSPCLSNVLMYDFDMLVSKLASEDYVTYTRYADDITFSARRTGYLTGIERMLRGVLLQIKSPALKINERKTVLATPKYKRLVTGLILTNEGGFPLGVNAKD